jgi:hypothetical protein
MSTNSKVKVGDPIRLNLQLFDGDAGKFVQAYVRDSSGAQLAGSPVTLTHTDQGLYEDDSLVMPDNAEISAVYKVFNDAGFSSPSAIHSDAIDIYQPDRVLELANQLVANACSTDLEGILIDNEEIVGTVDDCPGE